MTEETTNQTELTYNPYATIVYNSNPVPYSGTTPALASADLVTSTFRNNQIRVDKINKINGQHDKVREYLIENYEELDEHAVAIAKMLDLDLDTEITVEISASIQVTLSVPVGTSVYDLSTYDFDVDITCNEPKYEIQDYNADVEDIRSR
jgi:hypothetical protein